MAQGFLYVPQPTSLNGITGPATIVGGSNVTVSTVGTVITVSSSGGGGGAWAKYTLPYTSFASAGSTASALVVTLAAKTVVDGVIVKHSTPFSGGSTADCALSVADGNDAWQYSQPLDVFQPVSDAAYQSADQQHPVGFVSGGSLYAYIQNTGDVLNNLTAGSVDVWVLTSSLP